jgi:FdhD protein
MADSCGMTLAAIARKDGFEVFTHPHRIKGRLATHVA